MENHAETLKRATTDLHRLVENHPLQRRLSSRPTVEDYARYLIHLRALHQDFEPKLEAARQRDDALAGLVRPYHFRLDRLNDDLHALASAAAEEAPNRHVQELWSQLLSPFTTGKACGVLYVLEGSTNGGAYLAHTIREHLALPDDRGVSYLNPHGKLQRRRWKQFQEDINRLPLSEEQVAGMLAAACETFRVFLAISEAISSPQGPGSAPDEF